MIYFAGPIFEEWWWEPLFLVVFSTPFIVTGVIIWAILKYIFHLRSKRLFIKTLVVSIIVGFVTIEAIWYLSSP